MNVLYENLFSDVPRLYGPGEEVSIGFIKLVWRAAPFTDAHFRFILGLIVDHCNQFPGCESTVLWTAIIRAWLAAHTAPYAARAQQPPCAQRC